MIRHLFASLLFLSLSLPGMAQATAVPDVALTYRLRMDSLIVARKKADREVALKVNNVEMNPYYYRLLAGGTLYSGTLKSMMDLRWNSQTEEPLPYAPSLGISLGQPEALDVAFATDRYLAEVYVTNPELIGLTQEDINTEPKFRERVEKPIETETDLTSTVESVDLDYDVDEPVVVEAVRPKFWTIKGNGSIQMTQSYYSDNWYQGGDNNFAELTTLTIEANFDNKQKIQWDNKLEIQLGLQTTKDDDEHKVKPTSNLIRYTSSLGYQAAKSWYYTASLLTYTQLLKNYDSNSTEFTSCFGSPTYLTLSVGMTYKFSSKKEKFSGSLLLSPVAYNMRHVGSNKYYNGVSLKEYHSIPEGKRVWSNYGPSVTLNYTWTVCNYIKWESRMYYYTNLHYADWEWENTFTFTINKYLSSKVFLYPRYDDSSTSYKDDDGHYFMFKEWLSLGLSFSF